MSKLFHALIACLLVLFAAARSIYQAEGFRLVSSERHRSFLADWLPGART